MAKNEKGYGGSRYSIYAFRGLYEKDVKSGWESISKFQHSVCPGWGHVTP